MAQPVLPFELVAWGARGAITNMDFHEKLSDTGATLHHGSHRNVHKHGARIELGLRHVTAAGPVLVPCAHVAVPGPPDASDPAKNSKTIRTKADDGAGSLSVTYRRGRDGWVVHCWSLEYDSAKSRSPTMRAYCAHVAAKRAALARPTCDARRHGVVARRGFNAAAVEEARGKLRAAEGARADDEVLAEAELAQVAREEALFLASVAEMERALR